VRNRRLGLLLLVLFIAALLAFLLHHLFTSFVIYPLAKLLFIVRGYYRAIAQASCWPFVLVAILLIGLASLHLVELDMHRVHPQKNRQHGEVHQLSFWLERVQGQARSAAGLRQNTYSRWVVARAMADLAVDILNRRGAVEDRENRLQGPGWSPPRDVQEYLEIGLRSNPVTFAQMLKAAQLSIPGAETVISYLESYVESTK